MIHVNHSKNGSETILLFSSHDSAEAADNLLKEKGYEEIPGVKEILEAQKVKGCYE